MDDPVYTHANQSMLARAKRGYTDTCLRWIAVAFGVLSVSVGLQINLQLGTQASYPETTSSRSEIIAADTTGSQASLGAVKQNLRKGLEEQSEGLDQGATEAGEVERRNAQGISRSRVLSQTYSHYMTFILSAKFPSSVGHDTMQTASETTDRYPVCTHANQSMLARAKRGYMDTCLRWIAVAFGVLSVSVGLQINLQLGTQASYPV